MPADTGPRDLAPTGGAAGAVALRCEGLTKHFGGVKAVDDVDLELRFGEVVALVGPNGAGKSTLIDVITGYVPADAGRVVAGGRSLSGPPWRRARVGQVRRTFQHPKLARGLRIDENVVLGALGERAGSASGLLRSILSPRSGRVMAAARQVGADRALLLGLDTTGEVSSLSMGEQRLTELGRALCGTPHVVFLDEPFAGADDPGIERMGRAIRGLADGGSAVVVVDHHVDLLADMAERLVLMFEGAVRFDGDPHAGLRSREMRTIYFGESDG